MKKLYFIAFWAFICMGLAALVTLWIKAPDKIEQQFTQNLNALGFASVNFPEPQREFGKIIYNNISLDKDNFSTIGTLELTYTPLSILGFKKIETLKVEDIDLTGELNPDLSVTIAGLTKTKKKTASWSNLSSLAQTIDFKNAKISLLSEKLGGLSISGEMQLRPQSKHSDIRGRIQATQKQLNAEIALQGRMHEDGSIALQGEVEKAKLNLNNIRATRLSGNIRIEGQNFQSLNILGELESGGLNMYNQPWENAAITIDGAFQNPNILIGAKSIGVEGLELSLNTTLGQQTNPALEIYADTLKNAALYLRANNLINLDDDVLNALPEITDIKFKTSGEETTAFNITDDNQTFKISGNVASDEGGTKTIEFDSVPVDLKTLSENITGGQLRLSGKLNHEPNKPLSGIVKTQLQNYTKTMNNFNLTIPEMSFRIDPSKPLTNLNKTANCEIEGLHEEVECSVNIALEKNALQTSELTLSGPGLELNITPLKKNGLPATLFNIKNLDIAEVTRLFGNQNWSGFGTLKGSFLSVEENGFTNIENLDISNNGAGILKITDPAFFKFMDIEDLEKETLRLAFENLHFSTLKIKGQGRFPEDLELTVIGKGKNPDLMQGRTFSFDFKISPNLTPVFAKMN